MSHTITATAQRHEVYPEITPELYGTAVTQLKNILVESADDAPDSLYLSLQNWGIEVINTPITEDFEQKAVAKIDELRYEILGDPFDMSDNQRLVVDPLYDGEWIWSQPTLEDFLKLSPVSPFSPEKVLQPKPHNLARKICQWLKTFMLREPEVPLSESKELTFVNKFNALTLSNPLLDTFKKQMQLNVWLANARSARFRRDGIQQRKIAHAATEAAKEGIMRCRELLKQEAELLRQEREEHEQMVNERIATVEQTGQARNDILKTRLTGETQKVKAAEGRLDKAEQELGSANQRISQLNLQISQQAQQLASQRSGGGGGFCAIL